MGDFSLREASFQSLSSRETRRDEKSEKRSVDDRSIGGRARVKGTRSCGLILREREVLCDPNLDIIL